MPKSEFPERAHRPEPVIARGQRRGVDLGPSEREPTPESESAPGSESAPEDDSEDELPEPRAWNFPAQRRRDLEAAVKARAREPIADRGTEPNVMYSEYEIDRSEYMKEQNRQWVKLTGLIQMEMVQNPKVRTVLRDFISTPASEELSREVVVAISKESDLVSGFLNQNPQSMEYLSIPAVPDSEIVTKDGDPAMMRNCVSPPDISRELEKAIREVGESEGNWIDNAEQVILQKLQAGAYDHGITSQEHSLIRRRYKMARDLKMVMLGAELLDLDEVETEGGEKISLDKGRPARLGRWLKKLRGKEERSRDMVVTLPSGIRITLLDATAEDVRGVLDPVAWTERRHDRDRIHFATIGKGSNLERQLVMKDKKGPRHRDAIPEKETNTSEAEIEIARHLKESEQMRDGYSAASWENPVGAVLFPDGGDEFHEKPFNFSVFERQPGLVGYHKVVGTAMEVLGTGENRETMEREHREFLDVILPRILEDPNFAPLLTTHCEVTSAVQKDEDGLERHPHFRDAKGAYDCSGVSVDDVRSKIDFERFVRMHTAITTLKGISFFRESAVRQGYVDEDKSSDAEYMVHDPSDGGVLVEVFGFDTEYFKEAEWKKEGGNLPEGALETQREKRQDELIASEFWVSLGDYYDRYERVMVEPAEPEQEGRFTRGARYESTGDLLKEDRVLYCAMLAHEGMVDLQRFAA